MKTKTCIIIAGPTAVGKTAIGIQLAKYFNTSIISADSRQCYKELNIGVAKPSAEELQQVYHFFIDSHTISDNLSAADFEKYALNSVYEIFKSNDVAIMVGGTGLYIKSFCEGMDMIPEIPAAVRASVVDGYENFGLEWLKQSIQENDFLYASSGDMQNPQRMMRALEVAISTGNSIISFQKGEKKLRDFDIIKIVLDLPRNKLYERINLRVEAMIKMGLEEEANSLRTFRNLNALQTVGYRELFDYFDGNINLEQALSLIKQNSRHYAKRQLTWFRKDESFHWMPPDTAAIIEYLKHIGIHKEV